MLSGSSYHVIEVISDNGSKAVYRCIDQRTGDKVIAKALRAAFTTYDEVLKFKREYKVLSELSRTVPGVIKPLYLEEAGGFYILALEDIEADTLKTVLAENKPDQQALLKLAVQIVEIVGAIHDHQVIHKDLKPSNIIWNRSTGEVRIIDFEMSTMQMKAKQSFQNTGIVEGTLPYISPEQTGRINRSIDYRSDLYSLGVVFYEMFTGILPYESDTMMEQFYAIIAKRAISPYELTQGQVAAPLSDLIMKLLEKSPEDRYHSAKGIKADLIRCLNQESNFSIGEQDHWGLFRISQRLFGRDGELLRLHAAFLDSVKGGARLALVSGEAGVGKTAIVNELHRYISLERGYFIQGKFDQYNKNVPYSAIIQAFRTLLSQLLSSDEEQRSLLRSSLKSCLGDNGALIAALIPELTQLTGDLPEAAPLNPAEETNRFYASFVQFIEGLTRSSDIPLVLFLDDLQWADASSLRIMEKLLGNKLLRKLFIIGAYRNNEVHKGHPFFAAIEEIEKRQDVTHVYLNPLAAKDVRSLIQDTLGAENELVDELSGVVCDQTKGNPFFINEVLRDLYKSGIVFFDVNGGSWGIDRTKLSELKRDSNLTDYLMDRIKSLPEEVQRIVGLGASIGQTFDWHLLSLVSEQPPAMLAAALIRAVQEDIVFPLSHHYHLLTNMAEDDGQGLEGIDISFTFIHDKLQQALYQSMDSEIRKGLHLTIGRLLLQHLSPGEAEDRLIQIANHLSKGLDFVTAGHELEQIGEIHLKAAKKAKEGFGYETAFEFLQVAKELLPKDVWSIHYTKSLEIYKLFCECAYLIREVRAADEACSVLVRHAKSQLERASVYEMQANHYMYLGMMKESIEAARCGLKCLEVRIPRKPTMAHVLFELARVKWVLKGRQASELLHGPLMDDERIKLIMRLLFSFIPPAFISGEQAMFGFVVLRKAYLSAKHGIGPESAGAYTGYAMLLSGLGDLQGARDYGELAVQINVKFDDLQWRSLVNVLYTLFSHGWSHSWVTLESQYKNSIESSLKSGDLLYLAHACYYMNLWHPTMDIERYLNESAKTMAIIENTKYEEALATARLARQKFRTLSGEHDNPHSFDDASFSENAYLEQLTKANYYSGIAIYYINKLQIAYLFGQHAQAPALIKQLDKVVSTLKGSLFMEEYSLYTFLNLANCYAGLGLADRIKARSRMRKEYARMKKWALHYPDNFLAQTYMMQAELARIGERHGIAQKLYQLAMETAGRGSILRYKALASELAGKYYYERGLYEVAGYLLRQASYYYSVWGAQGKVNQLEKLYPELLRGVNRLTTSLDKTISTAVERIDIHSMILASQALAKEIELDQLLDTLIRIVIVNAGAERGCILMRSSNRLIVEGEYRPEENGIRVMRHDSSSYEYYPKSIIETVSVDRQTVIYQDAGVQARALNDVYLIVHKPKSVLCMPLINQNKVVAVIYLENNLVSGAFTKERVQMIELMSREMVYSLENASLYTDLESSEKKYRELVSHLMDGIVIIQNDRITFANDAMAEMLGCSVEELTNEQVDAYMNRRDFESALKRHDQTQLREGEFVEYEVELTHRDGKRQVYVIFKATAIEYLSKPAILGTVKDITERKRAEEELRKHRDKLEELVAQRTEELERKNEQLKLISITDELTGLYNRRYFKEMFWREIKRAARSRDPLSFILLDIDYYKKYNDTYGHYEGDEVLRKLGQTVKGQLKRATDFAFRLGGEEFGILYSGVELEDSRTFAEKIRKSIEGLAIVHEQNECSRFVTVSIGLSVAVAGSGTQELNEAALYKLADDALYEAKAGGRNRVVTKVL